MDQILMAVICCAACVVIIQVVIASVCFKIISTSNAMINKLVDKLSPAEAAPGPSAGAVAYHPELYAPASAARAAYEQPPASAYQQTPAPAYGQPAAQAYGQPPAPVYEAAPVYEPAYAPAFQQAAEPVHLVGVDDASAAMVMAIVAHELGSPPDELRFISIKAC